MSNTKVVILNDKVVLMEEIVQKETRLVDYMNALEQCSPYVCRKTPRLPGNCIGYHQEHEGELHSRVSLLIYVPARKHILRYRQCRSYRERDTTAPLEKGVVLLPDLIFKIVLRMDRTTNFVERLMSVYVSMKPSTELLLDNNTRLTRPTLPNLNGNGRVCFGDVSKKQMIRGRSIFHVAQEAISSYITSEGNDDYSFCLPYSTFTEWVTETKEQPREKLLQQCDLCSRASGCGTWPLGQHLMTK